MTEGRNCCVYLPNESKLELTVQPKLLGKDLVEIVAKHFNLKENDYFGICYKSDSDHTFWLQNDKRILEHDFVRKTTPHIELHFAIKFYTDSVISLKQCLTIELYFLLVKSLIYKGEIEVDCKTAFKLAAHVLQITFGDFTDDLSAVERLRQLPVLPEKILQEHPPSHCEASVLENYKLLKGNGKGQSILKYMTCVELLTTYGIHFYKVKDKSGLPLWLGLSNKGIHQFDFDNRKNPTKNQMLCALDELVMTLCKKNETFHWKQLENLFFRDKKFSIEVKNQVSRQNGLSVDSRVKAKYETLVFAWYGHSALIKSIWLMCISQHHFYLDEKRAKANLKDTISFTILSDNLTNYKDSLITTTKECSAMTQTQINEVSVTVKKGSREETPAVRAAKRDMLEALKVRRTELEDRLFDKVQELKKKCLLEAELIRKLPPEYIRYMDLDEKPPKIKKRVGAEFKVKLPSKDGGNDRDYPSTVTTTSSSSSGFCSEHSDPSDLLLQLEQEFEILTQIAQAAKKLALDPSAKGRTRTKRMRMYKNNLDKLQKLESQINNLREKCGRELSSRVSLFLPDEDLMLDDGELNLSGKGSSEKSSLSDGLLLDDDISLSSGGEVLSTHSTPAVLSDSSHFPGSAMLSRRSKPMMAANPRKQRSLTPPPSFDRSNPDPPANSRNAPGVYPLLASHSQSPDDDDASQSSSQESQAQIESTRDWISQKWAVPRSKPGQGWNESLLDEGSDNSSSAIRRGDDSKSTRFTPSSNVSQPPHSKPNTSASRVEARPMKAFHRSSANTNHNNHNEFANPPEIRDETVNATTLKREVGDGSSSDLSARSNSTPVLEKPHNTTSRDGAASGRRKESGLNRIPENARTSTRRRSSVGDSPPATHRAPQSGPHVESLGHPHSNKSRSSAFDQSNADYRPQRSHEVRRLSQGDVIDDVPMTKMTKSRSAHQLQPAIFDTNKNIQMQYSKSRNPQSVPLSSAQDRTANYSNLTTRRSQPELHQPHADFVTKSHHSGDNGPTPHHYHDPATNGAYYRLNPAGYHPSHAPRPLHSNHVDHRDASGGWLPSLSEYSRRASVCESSSLHDRKEDIFRVLQDFIATKRTPSNASSGRSNATERNATTNKTDMERNLTENDRRAETEAAATHLMKQVHVTNPPHRTNIFHHQPHRILPNRHQVPSNQTTTRQQPAHTSTGAFYSHPAQYFPHDSTGRHGYEEAGIKQRLLFKHYFQHQRGNHAFDSNRGHFHQRFSHDQRSHGAVDHARPDMEQQYYTISLAPSHDNRNQAAHYRWMSEPSNVQELSNELEENVQSSRNFSSKDGEQDKGPAHLQVTAASELQSSQVTTNVTVPDHVVVQSVRKGPDGHDVSIFKVTKSAPNTPMLKRHKRAIVRPALSSSDESDNESSRAPSAVQLQNALLKSFGSEGKRSQVEPVIIHTPRVKPPSSSDTTTTNQQSESKDRDTSSHRRHASKSSESSKHDERAGLSSSPKFNFNKQRHKDISDSHRASNEASPAPNDAQSGRTRVRHPSMPTSRLADSANNSSHAEAVGTRAPSTGILSRPPRSNRWKHDSEAVDPVALKSRTEGNYRRSQSDNLQSIGQHRHVNQPVPYYEPTTLRRYHLNEGWSRDRHVNATTSRGRSASAENLLWSEEGDDPAGTLV